jgi:hypothetical protein
MPRWPHTHQTTHRATHLSDLPRGRKDRREEEGEDWKARLADIGINVVHCRELGRTVAHANRKDKFCRRSNLQNARCAHTSGELTKGCPKNIG